jgi:hypothetical protein
MLCLSVMCLACGCRALRTGEPPETSGVGVVEPVVYRPIGTLFNTTADSTSGTAEVSDSEIPEMVTGGIPAESPFPGLGPLVDRLGVDLEEIATGENLLLLGAAAGTSAAIRGGVDADVRRATWDHPERLGKFGRAVGYLGNAEVQVPLLLASAWMSQQDGDPDSLSMHRSLVDAYTLTGLGTLLVKGMTNTSRPSDDWNGGQYGFPSFHAASSFTIAAVIDEYHGPRAGLPAMGLAGLISYSRIDRRDHDLSDVLFGAAMGYLVGRSVARWHLHGDGNVRLLPWSEAELDQADGVAITGIRWSIDY